MRRQPSINKLPQAQVCRYIQLPFHSQNQENQFQCICIDNFKLCQFSKYGLHYIMISYSIVFLILLPIYKAATLPCASNCATCSSGTQCTTCASQYFANSTSGSIQCQPCGQYCLNCTSSTNCTLCISPYVIQTDGSCQQCQISNAAKCSSVVSASQCLSGYYVSDNYCYSCLLNCADCTSSADCRSCVSGYYLNSSVLTCNFCPNNCLSCDQYNSSRCLSCADGYTLSISYTCDAVSCSISNCKHCQTPSICLQCINGYYWDSAQTKCQQGASIMCENGAEGPYPNQCNRKCSQYAYIAQQVSTAIWCLPYNNIRINNSEYSQVYLYAYNNKANFTQLLSTSFSLSAESTGQYSYPISASNILNIASLSSYYKITIYLKYRSSTPILLNLSSTTQSLTQFQNATIPAQTTVATVYKFSTIFLHSNNLQIKFNSSINVVEMLVRTKNCPSDCYRCLNEDLCEMCQAPQYVSSYKCVDNCTIYYHLVINRTCLTTCPDLYYPTNLGTNQKFCQPCVSPCQRCLSISKCLSCVTGKYLFNYTCLSTCPDTYYSGTSGLCEPCISPCKLCINQTTCVSCKQGFWDSIQAVCTVLCPNGYYGNDATQRCEPCQSPCLTCRNSSSRCLTCIQNYYYQDYQCLSSCPSRFYPVMSNMTCSPCRLPCLTCSTINSCLSCSYDFLYNSQCISICPTGYFENLVTKICQVCSPQCKTCEMYGQCTSCKNGTCFLEGSCFSTCPTGKYYTVILNQGTLNQECQCQQCQLPCKQCISSTQCTSCLKGYLLASTYQCLNSCPVGYYPNALNYQCSACSSKYAINCLQCNASSCTRCGSNYLLHNGICLASCPAQHYKSSQTCQKCVAPCLQCFSFTQCISCISPYLFSNGSCIIQCPFGKVSVVNITSNILTCISCQFPCVTCQGSSPTNCTMCTYGYFLYSVNNSCVTNCSAIPLINSFYDELVTSTCSKCMFPCKTCVSQTQCLTCQIGFLTNLGKCENCPIGTYADQIQGICVVCPSSCSSCYSYSYCTACNDGFFLYNHQCISNRSICIDNGYFPIGRVCEPCQMPCSHCNITSTNCLNCVTGYIFYPPNQCITQCPKGTFRNGSQCQLCHSYCESCSGTSVYCFGCNSPYLMVSSQMSCVVSCPNGTFNVNTTCQLCQYPCKQCTSQTHCTSCLTGTLIGNSCMSSCPSGYFSNSLTCMQCQSPCSQCQTSSITCKKCINGYFLINNQCLVSCPALYFPQSQSHQCLQCLGLCGECSSHINCTTCASGLIFYYDQVKNYGQCVSECPQSLYKTSVIVLGITRDECSKCLTQCKTCIDNVSCILCDQNLPQYLGQCISECPSRMYSHNGICTSCSLPCFNCTDAFTCTACMDDSFLLVGSAQCIVGQICPLGFYRIPGTRNCNGRCPSGFYHRNDRTCNNAGCDLDQYKGADMFCYKKCPDGFKSDVNYTCQSCVGEECETGLFYDITPAIIRDQIYLYIIFKEDPIYLVPAAKINLSPAIPYKTITLKTQRLLAISTQVSQIRNITLELLPESSFPQTQLTITFQSALQTFRNPIQRPFKSIVLQGFDLYPQVMKLDIGILLLAVALIGMVKNPYMTDFAQLIYLLALIGLHYPANLAKSLQSGSLAHLHGFMFVTQEYAKGKGKFSYITDLGLLSNCTINLLIIAIGLGILLLLLIIYQILKRATSYNKVNQDPNQNVYQQNPKQNEEQGRNTEEQPNSHDIESSASSSKSIRILTCLRQHVISKMKMEYINRLVYFNYLPLCIFTLGQLTVLSFNIDSDNKTDFLASVLSIILLLLLVIFPWYIFTENKPKYTFLMLKKLVLSLIIILSVQNPTYMIGVTAVIAIMTGILVGAYGMEKWKVQTRFNASMELLQAALMVLFAIFAIIGEGNYTNIRLALSWIIIFFIIAISLSYLIFSIFCFVLWGCKKFNNTDYIEQWQKQKQQEQSHQDSQQVNERPVTKSQQNQKQKSRSFEKFLSSIQKQGAKQPQNANRIQISNRGKKVHEMPITNNQLFWTYNDHDENQNQNHGQDNGESKAPDLLIRCVNQFSDYDPKEKRDA